MTVYLLLFISIILLSFLIFAKGTSNRKKILFLIISFGLMFLIMGFRTESVGTDTKLYCDIFQNNFSFSLNSIIKGDDTSFLYSIYNKIVSLFSTDRRAIIVSNSLIICILTAIFIYKNSKNVIFPTLFFMTFYHFFSAMNISRQYIAVMLVANAFYFLKNKKVWKYILLCTIATLVHNTAIVSFVMLPFLFIKPTKRNICIYLILITSVVLFLDEIISLFSTIFGHYNMYFNNNYLTATGENKKAIITVIYFVFAIIMFGLLKRNKVSNADNREFTLLYIINYLAIIMGVLSLKTILLTRIEIYFSIFAIISIPKVFDLMKDRVLYYFLFTIVIFIPMYILLSSNISEITPYSNWFFDFLRGGF